VLKETLDRRREKYLIGSCIDRPGTNRPGTNSPQTGGWWLEL